ncbi:MAG TPA: glutamate mutase L [Nocardioidaceae bacterium]|nr:glutamate mutase L [Nocardioidaceae bacterium]
MSRNLIACVDFGSTFTKGALVDVSSGELVAVASHRTTVDTDVLDGWAACLDRLAAVDPAARDAEVLACSSAGGGLRIAVVGNEELVTAEAGRRVALSSGGRVVHVASGGLDRHEIQALRHDRPDVVLLVGGTDGGNAEVLLQCADALAGAGWPGPVVVAGNIDAQAEVAARFEASGTPYVLADNVVPRIGVLSPGSARAAIRAMFLRHVIGGKHLSGHAEFTSMVQGATPDVVLTAVELLSRGLDEQHPGAGDVVVVDVGGATTDVYSVVEVDPEDAGLSREVVATVPASRTVEGDLGMRWSAESTVGAGVALALLDAESVGDLEKAAARRHRDPGYVPEDDAERALDHELASVAIGVAVRRHAGRAQVVFGPDGRVVERTGKDLREADLLVGSGGVLRHSGDAGPEVLLRRLGDDGQGWQLPESPRVVVDTDYVLAPAGLLAARHPVAAHRLLQRLLG